MARVIVYGVRDGRIVGRAPAYSGIEATNLSTIPGSRLKPNDTRMIARASARGDFDGALPAERGQLIKVRARGPGGRLTGWTMYRVGGGRRGASLVAINRIGAAADGHGIIKLFNLDMPRPIGEPGLPLRFVNARTSHGTIIELDRHGSFDARSYLPGCPADTYSVTIVPQTGAQGGAERVGTLQVTSQVSAEDDPLLHEDDLWPYALSRRFRPHFELLRFRGPLGAIKPDQVVQGTSSDCYLAAAACALAVANGTALRRALGPNQDGRYSVRFWVRDGAADRYRQKRISVAPEFFVTPSGQLLYGSSPRARSGRMPLWWALLEKAYAQLRKGYGSFDEGGYACEVFETVLGRRPRYLGIDPRKGSAVWRLLTASLEGRLPVAAGTLGRSSQLRYRNRRIFPDHYYAVLKSTIIGEEQWLILRNPWGQVTPAFDFGEDRGVFALPFSQFLHLFRSIETIQ